jgi:hypothetical protein
MELVEVMYVLKVVEFIFVCSIAFHSDSVISDRLQRTERCEFSLFSIRIRNFLIFDEN